LTDPLLCTHFHASFNRTTPSPHFTTNFFSPSSFILPILRSVHIASGVQISLTVPVLCFAFFSVLVLFLQHFSRICLSPILTTSNLFFPPLFSSNFSISSFPPPTSRFSLGCVRSAMDRFLVHGLNRFSYFEPLPISHFSLLFFCPSVGKVFLFPMHNNIHLISSLFDLSSFQSAFRFDFSFPFPLFFLFPVFSPLKKCPFRAFVVFHFLQFSLFPSGVYSFKTFGFFLKYRPFPLRVLVCWFYDRTDSFDSSCPPAGHSLQTGTLPFYFYICKRKSNCKRKSRSPEETWPGTLSRHFPLAMLD